MTEQVGRAPQQFNAGSFLFRFGIFNNRFQPFCRFSEGAALFNEIKVVKAVVRRSDLGDELERGIHLVFRAGVGIGTGKPRERMSRTAERITSGSAERVPVANGKT
jgi:hypothetical protein